MGRWGVNAPRLRQTLADVEAAAAGSPPAPDDVLIRGSPPPLREPPFHAVEVQPSITFTFGGLRGDADGRALDPQGRPVPGLFVAGADLGGVQETGYVGGLVLGLVFGPRAADAALGASPAGGDVQCLTTTPDVLIIGAGASGAVAAKRLVEEGFDVVCLEQGDWPDYTLARAAHPDYELTAARDWNWDPNLRAAPADYPVDDSDSDITALMWNGVGGGTVVYAAHWQRNMPSDFRVRTLDGVADDWPLTYEDLEPYYVRVERDWGVSGLAGDTGFPGGEGPPMPPVPMGEMGRRVARAHNELGWHWWPAPNAIATRPYGRLNACVQRATCLRACADGRQGERRHHVLAGRDRARREAAHGRSREAPDRRLRRAGRGRPLHRLRRRRAGAARRGDDPLL